MAQEISSQSATNIIKVLEQWVSKVGLPLVIRSDNGTCFTARDYVKWAEKMFIKLVYSSPYNPESNGGAESAVKMVKEILKREGKNGLQTGLLSLNTTVKQGMDGSPMDLFIGREVKSMIPGQRDRRITKEEIEMQRREIQERLQSKKRRKAREILEVGDKVAIQDPITKKWSQQGKIEKKVLNGDASVSSFEVLCNEKILHRSSRYLQRLHNQDGN